MVDETKICSLENLVALKRTLVFEDPSTEDLVVMLFTFKNFETRV